MHNFICPTNRARSVHYFAIYDDDHGTVETTAEIQGSSPAVVLQGKLGEER